MIASEDGSTPGQAYGARSQVERSHRVAQLLNSALQEAGLATLDASLALRFESYLSLILRWNQRVNLTAIRDEQGIISRHFVESIACARALPAGIASLLDLGSGAGLPGIPIALCRPEVSITLAESQGKKAAFLQEAVRVLGLSAKVHGRRAEELKAVFDCVTLRAVDRMQDAVKVATGLTRDGGWLALMTTESEAEALQAVAGSDFSWGAFTRLPGSAERIIALGQKVCL